MGWINILNIIYPVGSIYCSTTNISPASSIGGSWTQIENAALRSGDSVGYTGSDTHAITTTEMPSHSHEIWTVTNPEKVVYHMDSASVTRPFPSARVNDESLRSTYLEAKAVGGGGQAMSLVQRSFNCYMWYRTA